MSDESKPKRLERYFLCPGAKHGNGIGYTDIPELGIRGEPEGLSPEEWDRHVAKRAVDAETHRLTLESARRERDRRLMDFETRLTTAHEAARRRCIDVASEVRLLRHMQGSGKQVRHLEQRLFAIERKVWREPEDFAA